MYLQDPGASSFRTEVPVLPSQWRLSHSDKVLLCGSCFSENVADRMRRAKVDVVVNPFGIVFHPVAIARGLHRLAAGRPYVESDLRRDALGRFYSFDHHTRFSHPDPAVALARMNGELSFAAEQLREARWRLHSWAVDAGPFEAP